MAKKSMIIKAQRQPKYQVRRVNRCRICGRPRGYMRRFQMCRVFFRKYANEGQIPGVTKASW
ncbi:MAG: type Z 30S ribosomal protein S14 [Bacillota bacterium]|nr:type Z 30S ribosomal protein S14 [Bacillota bacterium]